MNCWRNGSNWQMWRIRSINQREKGTRRQKRQEASYSHKQKRGEGKGIVGVVLLGVMMGLAGWGGMGGAGWGNPEVVGVVNGQVYVSSKRKQELYVLRGIDGERLWQWKMGVDDKPQQIMAGDGRVYVEMESGKIVALEEKDGREIWSYNAGA